MQAHSYPSSLFALIVEYNPALQAVASIHLRKLGYQVCATILGISAGAVESDCIDSGMDAFIPKPLDLPLLKSIVSREENLYAAR